MSLTSVGRYSTLVLIAAIPTAFLFAAYPAIDPGAGWNDHYFYWGQANEWLNLQQPLVLTPDVQALLDKYRVDYYYEVVNGSSQQPPYVYRIAVPLAAGLLGLLVPLAAAFGLLTVVAFLVLGASVGSGIAHLTRSYALGAISVPLALAPVGFSTYTQFFAMVDVPSIAVVAVTLHLVIVRKFAAALLISAVLAPLVKETLIGLAAFVALYMWIQGNRTKLKWVAAITPILLVGLMRLLIPVPKPPATTELFVQASPFESIFTFLNAFAVALPLVIGLLAARVRPLVIASTPVVISLMVITSSVVASGPRIWLTYWPFVVVLGAVGLWTSARSKRMLFLYITLTYSGFLIAHLVQLGLADRIILSIWLFIVVALMALVQAVESRRFHHEQSSRLNPATKARRWNETHENSALD